MPNKLTTEVWISDLKENPIPNNSFLTASLDRSEYVDNNILHLQEAGARPSVYMDYFSGNENDLPFADTADTPHSVPLSIFSTAQTKHRNLQDVELSYDRRSSVIKRHKDALAIKLGMIAANTWCPTQKDSFNEVLVRPNATDGIIDMIIEMKKFYENTDLAGQLNVCLSPEHKAILFKEDKVLYKQIFSDSTANLYGFKVFEYSKNPIYTSAGVRKPMGSVAGETDRKASFFWCSDEVFTCFGDVEMYARLKDPAQQADTLSFAIRALVGNERANAPKYLGAIL
ncbi:MAG: hypothetical protein C4K58_06905 [Flavobacteriaceae bacterium]|nr:MAG: hypothetical protein C4K58_06905 [Flavobacteriaceae bacterium]